MAASSEHVKIHLPETVTEMPPFQEDTDRARKLARLDLRVMLNQHDGTFTATNRLADELAHIIVRTLRQEGIIHDGL